MSALETLRSGGKRSLARALASVEAAPDAPQTQALLDAAWRAQHGHALGLTGPPGVGKSTLIDALIRAMRAQGQTVGVIAVDPSSRVSRGALLGDRTRLSIDPEDQGVFVRSMAARDRLGGLAELTFPALVLMRAVHDLVIVETVGVGQSETDVLDIADTVVFCAQPGSGDALQFMKAGIMEIPHVVVVTKGDMGAVADRAVADLRGALSLAAPGAAEVPVLRVAAAKGEGVEALVAAVRTRAEDLARAGTLDTVRRRQTRTWMARSLAEAFGREGLARVRADLDTDSALEAPFKRVAEAKARLSRALSVGFAPQVADSLAGKAG